VGKSVGGLCKAGQPKVACLSVLNELTGLSEWDKLGVALGLSFEPMRESIARAVEDTLAPQFFYPVIATGLLTWLILAANPEPVFTKAAAIVSAVMLIYLGVDAFLSVVKASMELKRATDRATSKPTYGHTFLDHTHKLSRTQLVDRARSLGHQVGQWTDDKAAATFIADVAKRGPGVHDVPLPKGLGRSFLADATELVTDMARVVVKPNGAVRTAFPYNSTHPN
jgi:hypothetical protein